MRFPEGVTISVIIVDEIQSWNVNYIELIMLGSVSVLMALIHWRHFVKKLGFQIPAEVRLDRFEVECSPSLCVHPMEETDESLF